MERIVPGQGWSLHDVAATRRIESALAIARPPHDLMQRAGLAVARLALALAPHARRVWVACGPGNNGGDGFEAALHLHGWGREVVVSFVGDPARLPSDAAAAFQRARLAGVVVRQSPPPEWDLCIDAMLGIGSSRPLHGTLADWQRLMNAQAAPVLAVDVPSGLDADTGSTFAVQATHTLSLLTLKPGLFTAHGRDAAGQIWLDDLQAPDDIMGCTARLLARPGGSARLHASHKGSFGDVAVIGGAPGMAGAALLAGRAALHGGAGRVYVGLLDDAAPALDGVQPELMLRRLHEIAWSDMAVVCGCGGGAAVTPHLPAVLSSARALVLDADALNAIAADRHLQSLLRTRSQRGGWSTVLTPHPLEAARLLGTGTASVQADRLAAARRLSDAFPGLTLALKGSGTIVASQGQVPALNPTGNARLATAGTGDVLAGMVAARLAGGEPAFSAACAAVYLHGAAADNWTPGTVLTAGRLAAKA